MSSEEYQPSRLRGWLDWAIGRKSSPPTESQPSEATALLVSIGATMDRKHIPTEVRLIIFGYVLQNEPAWDISNHSSIPDWVTPDLEEVWFRNTNFFLPVPSGLGCYEYNTDVTLEANAIRFLTRLSARRNSHPVTVEVIVADTARLEHSQASFHRMLLVSYHLGNRQDLLDMKLVIEAPFRKYDASSELEGFFKERLLRSCATMKKFRDGTFSMKDVFESVGVVFDPNIVQVYSPESLVARLLSREISEPAAGYDRTMLRVKIIMSIQKAQENEAEE